MKPKLILFLFILTINHCMFNAESSITEAQNLTLTKTPFESSPYPNSSCSDHSESSYFPATPSSTPATNTFADSDNESYLKQLNAHILQTTYQQNLFAQHNTFIKNFCIAVNISKRKLKQEVTKQTIEIERIFNCPYKKNLIMKI